MRDLIKISRGMVNGVKILASKDVKTIARITRMGPSLVEEYPEIIRTYYPECIHLNSKEVNIDGKGNQVSHGTIEIVLKKI